MKTYAQRLLEAVRESGLKDSDFNRELGASHGFIANVRKAVAEGGEYMPKADVSAKAARLLQVRHEWLALGEAPMRPLDGRDALSARAIYLGEQFDKIDSSAARDRAYALLIHALEFSALPRESEAAVKPIAGRARAP